MIILISFLNSHKKEMFREDQIYPTRLFGMAKHVRLNKFNRVESVYIHPPRLKIGETRCDVVNCPSWIPSDAICYKCI
mgnify:CR=1 FL=1